MTDWLAAVVVPLNAVAFTLWGDPVSWAELFAFLTGGVCVALTVRRSIANFPVGIANSSFFLVLFASARLWADSGLQVIYIVLGFIGWWQWLYGNTRRTPLQVRGVSRRQFVWCVLAVATGTALLYPLLRSVHDSAPFLDALTTSLSLVAQWLLNGKRIESLVLLDRRRLRLRPALPQPGAEPHRGRLHAVSGAMCCRPAGVVPRVPGFQRA